MWLCANVNINFAKWVQQFQFKKRCNIILLSPRDGHSCETALHELISKLNLNHDKPLINLLLFSSSRPSQLSSSLRRQVWSAVKRLDTISPKLLIMFDAHLGWCSSEIFKVATNIFQGSVLGPLFFFTFYQRFSFHPWIIL